MKKEKEVMIHRTRKLNLTIPDEVFDELMRLKVLHDIDNIVTELLIAHFHMDD